MNMISVLMSRQVHAEFEPRIRAILEETGAAVQFELVDPHAVPAAGPAVDAAFLTLDIRHSADSLKAFVERISAPGFRWVHFPGSGYSQHKWLAPLMARGVRVTTSTGANAESVAVTALTGMLMLARRAAAWIDDRHTRQWNTWPEPEAPADLAGQTVVVVGVGAIGGRFARYAKMLGMQVIGVRRSPRREEDAAERIVPPSELPALLPEADWLVLTCPLTDETFHLVDARKLALMKPGAYVINVARGEVVDDAALIPALQNRQIAGAYLDVFPQEPPAPDSPVWTLPNLILSPHIAALSRGNQWRATEIFMRNMAKFARGETLVNEVPAASR